MYWIGDWLRIRTQCVKLNGILSDVSNVLSGVPQGSVLGPLLFTIYINDIDSNILSKLNKFADDTKLCRKAKSNEDINILNSDLDKLYKWSREWQMLFNVEKCTVIHLGNKNSQGKYRLGNTEIKNSNKERDLGVIIDDSGKFSEQCSQAARGANKILSEIYITNRKTFKIYVKVSFKFWDYCFGC